MDVIEIEGGAPLMGEIEISGAKNSALKVLVAALLTDETLTLSRAPVSLADMRLLCELLEGLGAEIDRTRVDEGELAIRVATISKTTAEYDLVRKMRATFNVLGPLLARCGRAKVSLPGGCAIGARPVDLHLKALEAMGAKIRLEDGYVLAEANGGLHGARIAFPFVSVGATEHAMMTAALIPGETLLENAAREPEIADLAACLTAMGAEIEGAGGPVVRIQGRDRLRGARHEIVADRIEAGTFAIAAAAAPGGDVMLRGARAAHLGALIETLAGMGVTLDPAEDGLRVRRSETPLAPVEIETAPYPGFPTDLQAQLMALATQAEGRSEICEAIFENRFMHAPELMRLGADIEIEGQCAHITGPSRLRGAPVMATDLRASVSLVIAALAAEGRTVINRVYHLDRGFERLEAKLSACGARITRRRAA
ncbi:MAG: UDP-N-acetylglucosamine 1-carboxyvinyltransferase [Parvularculaceae bacterium]